MKLFSIASVLALSTFTTVSVNFALAKPVVGDVQDLLLEEAFFNDIMPNRKLQPANNRPNGGGGRGRGGGTRGGTPGRGPGGPGRGSGGTRGRGPGGPPNANITFVDFSCAEGEEEIACAVKPRHRRNDTDASGVVACVEHTNDEGDLVNRTICAPSSIPSKEDEGETPTITCGCCGGSCTDIIDTCTCDCEIPTRGSDAAADSDADDVEAEMGVLMQREGSDGTFCVSQEMSVSLQLRDGRADVVCVTECPP